MAVTAANARALALQLVKCVDAYWPYTWNEGFAHVDGKPSFIGPYFLKYDPLIMPFPAQSIAEADEYAKSVIDEAWDNDRHLLTRLQLDRQAAALLVFSIRVSPDALREKDTWAILTQYLDGRSPPSRIGMPSLAERIYRFRFSGNTEAYWLQRLRAWEALFFFGKPFIPLSQNPDPHLRLIDPATWN